MKEGEKEAKKLGGKVERESGMAAKQAGRKADEATDSDLGAKAGRAAKQVRLNTLWKLLSGGELLSTLHQCEFIDQFTARASDCVW